MQEKELTGEKEYSPQEGLKGQDMAMEKENVKEPLPVRNMGDRQLTARKSKFKPDINYKWEPDDVFPLKGIQLATLHNTLNTVFNSDVPSQRAWVLLHSLLKVTTDIIREGVEADVIVPAEKEQG